MGSRGRSWRGVAGAASFGFAADPGCEPANVYAPLRPPGAFRTTDTLRPGQRTCRHLVPERGDGLVCGCYRRDPERRKRYEIVDLIVADADSAPDRSPTTSCRCAWPAANKPCAGA